MRALDPAAVNLPIRPLALATYNALKSEHRATVAGRNYAYVNGEWAVIRIDNSEALEFSQIKSTVAAGPRAVRRRNNRMNKLQSV